MGLKAKKARISKRLKKHSSSSSSSKPSTPRLSNETSDFLPLEGGPGKAIVKGEEVSDGKATVVYIGRIPHGFYEEQMKGFFSQFGVVKRLRIARSRKTGKSKHYGFLEFENPEVAKIVANEINNYKLMEHLLQVHLVPPERVHPKLWKGSKHRFVVKNWVEIERKRHNKEKTVEEHTRAIERILSRDKKRVQKMKAMGIDYECPDFVGEALPAPKKIKFSED